MPELPGGTVTFVFTDIEDSTQLLKRLGDDYREVLTAHRRIVRDTFTACDGIEIDTQGDAFFFVFPRARDAVAAAVEAQRAHASESWPGEVDVRVRIGLHTGEPTVHEEGYVGLDVVRAARICTVGRGGQILLSETTRALLGSGLPEGVSVFPLGQRHLRGIDEPERVFEIAIDGLDVEAADGGCGSRPRRPASPPAERELEQDIARRFDDLGARLAAGIQDRVLRSLEGKAGEAASGSAVDDIAARMESLGADIDARVQAALAKKGIPPSFMSVTIDGSLDGIDWVRTKADLAADDWDNGRNPEALRAILRAVPARRDRTRRRPRDRNGPPPVGRRLQLVHRRRLDRDSVPETGHRLGNDAPPARPGAGPARGAPDRQRAGALPVARLRAPARVLVGRRRLVARQRREPGVVVSLTQYYTATTLDGFIADPDNSLEWLFTRDQDRAGLLNYAEFIAGVGALAMGRTTYEWVLDHEFAGKDPSEWKWPYEIPCWVFTNHELTVVPGAQIEFVSGDVASVHAEMVAAAEGRNVWIVGGGDLAGQFAEAGLLDEVIVYIAPVTLGAGAPLLSRRVELRLEETGRNGDFVAARYCGRARDRLTPTSYEADRRRQSRCSCRDRGAARPRARRRRRAR